MRTTAMRFILLSAAFWVAFLAAPASADEASDDLNKLYGKWLATEGTWNGKALTKEQIAECKLYFRMTEFTPLMSLYVPDKLVGYTIVLNSGERKTSYVTSWVDYDLTLDPTQSPKTIKTGKNIGGMRDGFSGVYELDGDTLKVCFNLASSPRPGPKEFKSPRDSEFLLLTLKRKR